MSLITPYDQEVSCRLSCEWLPDLFLFNNRLDTVATFTASDFGRTLTVDGDGSDHGWGGHYVVMEGGVDDGKLFGEWPSFETAAADYTG